jgi:hypothetical protein
MTSPYTPGSRDDDVHEELARIKQENAHLNEALRSRTVIGQATGLLMATLDLSPDEAFAELTKMSSHANRKVRDVAATVVAAANATAAQPIAHRVALRELLGLVHEASCEGQQPAVRRGRAVRTSEDAS